MVLCHTCHFCLTVPVPTFFSYYCSYRLRADCAEEAENWVLALLEASRARKELLERERSKEKTLNDKLLTLSKAIFFASWFKVNSKII